MPDRITIERQGVRWIASDGATHCEADEPNDALEDLLMACLPGGEDLRDRLDSAARIQEAEDNAGRRALALVRLMALNAPPPILRNEVGNITRAVEGLIAVRAEESGDGR